MLARMKTSARMSAAQWGELVAAWEASGRSALSFADEHGIAESSLRWWRTELARRARKEAPKRSPGPRPAGALAMPVARVVRAGEEKGATRGQVSVVVGSARIVVEAGFDRQLLREVVQALGDSR
jgi:hypothetical protein